MTDKLLCNIKINLITVTAKKLTIEKPTNVQKNTRI